MLYKGSTLLLQHDQQGSGADLAILLIDVLSKSDTDISKEWIEKLAQLFELMSSSIPEREQFLTNSVKWSMDNSKKGHPLLHQVKKTKIKDFVNKIGLVIINLLSNSSCFFLL